MKAACYCGTKNLYEDMIPAVKSLIANSDVDKVFLLIEDDDFPYQLPDFVETINVSNQTFFCKDGPNFNTPWTYMVLMRAALHRVFPNLDKILSLDVDTIVAKDISKLWDIPLDGYYLAGAKEPVMSRYRTYINCGVMMLNLAKLRDSGKGDELIDALNVRRYLFNEQDCIAERCQGGILEIPSIYNANNYTEPTTQPKIVHFAAMRHYQNQPIVEMYKSKSWDELR